MLAFSLVVFRLALLWLMVFAACKKAAVVPAEVHLPPAETALLPQLAPEPERPEEPVPMVALPVEVIEPLPAVDAGPAFDEESVLYSWENASGATEVVQGWSAVPEAMRAKARRVDGLGGSLERQAAPASAWRFSPPEEMPSEEPAVAEPEVVGPDGLTPSGKNAHGETAHDFALRSGMGLPTAPREPAPAP